MVIDTSRKYKVADLEEKGYLLVQDGNHGGSRPRQHEFCGHIAAFIRAADLENGLIKFDQADHINEAAYDRITKGKAQGGDIIFSHKGTVGKLALSPLDSPTFVCSPQTTFWRTLNEDVIDRNYLFYFMQSSNFTNQWSARKGETDMADYVSLTAQRQLVVEVPKIGTQRATSSILSALDEKITLIRHMNRTLEAMAQAIFKSWFVDFDPVTATAAGRKPSGMDFATANLIPNEFQETKIGSIPKAWQIGSIDSLAKYVNGKNFTKNATGSGRLVIRIAELNSGVGNSTVYNEVEAKDENVARPGDLLFAWSGSLNVYRWYRDEALINQHIFKVICGEFPQWFVHFHLIEAMPFFQGIAADKATTMGHIKREHLKQATLAIPEKRLMDKATEIIEPLYSKILQNELEANTLSSLRDLLLPKLLSGEIRIKQAEKAIAKVS